MPFFIENGNYSGAMANLDITVVPKYFDTLRARAANPIVRMDRINGQAPQDYRLSIDIDGTIRCTFGPTVCPNIGCNGGTCN